MKRRFPVSGDRALEHLANERTFLAWVRAAMAGVALGIALERFSAMGQADLGPIGLILIAGGVGVLFYGVWRYWCVARDLTRGYFTVDVGGPVAITIGVLAIALVAVWTRHP